jgi:predicted  nucleic acid-binding Zn-ribbon protein
MEGQSKFKCLRCGHEFYDSYDPKVVVERTCPKCKSNSVRRVKES